jgi:hypothetical protein
MKAYKLTDSSGCSKSNTQWGENITHTATGTGTRLCSNGFLHFYTHPLIAVLMNPVHANFENPILWECETSGTTIHEPLKSGCKTLTTIKQIPLPTVTMTQRIAFGILCAKEVCRDTKWLEWAEKWLSGEDRTKGSARTIADITIFAAYHAASAVVDSYISCSYYTAAAADSAVYATANEIDFVKLAEEAMKY